MVRDRYFQWLDGDERGKVVKLRNIYEEDGETYFEFEDGESCSKEFISPMFNTVGEMRESRKNKDGNYVPAFLIEVSSPYNVWSWEPVKPKSIKIGSGDSKDDYEVAPPLEDILDVQSDGGVNTNEGKYKLVPPKERVEKLKSLPNIKDYRNDSVSERANSFFTSDNSEEFFNGGGEVNAQSNQKTGEVSSGKIAVKTSESDPVSILVNSSKKTEREIEISVGMMLPSKDLFDIVKINFEDGVDKFIDNVIKDLDVSVIIDAIRKSLKLAYNGEIGEEHVDEIDMSEEKCAKKSTQEDILLEFDEEGNLKEEQNFLR